MLRDNKDIVCFTVTKHSWKGRYKRIFSVGTMGITTYNPSSMENTNQWPYSEFIAITPSSKTNSANNEFLIVMKKGKKTDTMKFSSEYRVDVITAALKFRSQFAIESPREVLKCNAYKHHWSDTRLPVVLEVSEASVEQRDPTTNNTLATYNFSDIESLIPVSNYPGGFVIVCGGFGRMHLFASEKRDDILKRIKDNFAKFVYGDVMVKKDPISLEDFATGRLGKYSSDEAVTSLAEFTVQKISCRHLEPMKRILALTEECIVERDPATYCVATCRPLCEIFALVRCQDNPQQFCIEYVKGQIRTYISTDRDSLLASLIDGVRASGNLNVHVKMKPTNRGWRLGPFTALMDEEVESSHLRFLQQQPAGWTFDDAVNRFNANVSYNGLLHAVTQDGLFAENKEKLIHGALNALLDKEGDQNSILPEDLESQFQALRRLVASKAGFGAFTQLPKFRERVGVKVVRALKRYDDGVTYAAVDMICALMQPMHEDYDIRQEQLNKTSLLSSKKFLENLLDMFAIHVVRGSGALVVSAMLDFLTYALCAPYSETTEGGNFDALLEMVAEHGRVLYKLFQHPSLTVVKGAGLVMKAIIEEGDVEISAKMQELSLAEGALPRHLLIAMFTQGTDSRMLTNRQLSRHLVGLWVTGHPTAMGLLKRIFPPGLMIYLDSTDKVPNKETDLLHIRDNLQLAQDHSSKNRKNPHWRVIERHLEHALQHWRSRIGVEKKEDKIKDKPIVLRKRRERVRSENNWAYFYYKFSQDHAKPNLIWNFKTREELRDALEDEIRAFNTDRDLGGSNAISWNHQEFEVLYNCLSDEIKIGDYYLRLLLEEDEKATDENSQIRRSYEFFNDLYHRFLLTSKTAMKCMCLQAMAIVYGRHYDDIGIFNDTKFMVAMLEKSTNKMERDRLILFLNKLILNKRNVKELLDASGVKVLVDLLTLAHLHTSRATVPAQSNVIEAAPNSTRESEKEWYYGNVEKERLGPFSFKEMKDFWADGVIHSKTRCWAQGMDGWRPLINIPQLRWSFVASDAAVMNESELATMILNMLIRICEYFPSRDSDGAIIRPLPRAKRLLSEPVCLPHIVQLLLTFDPILVEKVATLLHLIVQDNPAMPRVFFTGVFFFILMYTGSNVLPVGKFLQLTHAKQTFRLEENMKSGIMQRSILGQILPEAMVCYLENYGAERFSEIFLGEFDTPEVIWNNEMRRMMIQKLAAHVADFSPRLQSNTRALYQYCPIPLISYPQLENELFCNIYYLRHLCDPRFQNWPIKDPVTLLKDVLEAWKKEVEKKPPMMSVDDAYEELGLERGILHDDNTIRKSYFRLAQKYHPDKNADGREIFEKVNKAYEFLCSKSARVTDGPDPVNIVLILRAQSILFDQYKDDLKPYKYSGYPMLIKTIQMEVQDDNLFSKSTPFLTSACELAYHTVNCSALNAEEMRREKGLELLQEAFSRCASVISRSSQTDDFTVTVCLHVCHCFSVAALFPACREKIIEMTSLIKDMCRILYFKHLVKLCTVVTECICAFAYDAILQLHLLQSGVLWHLLLFLFNYDFTLDEGGVEKNESSNQQEVANRLAKMSLYACSRLGGYLSDEESTPENPDVKRALNSMLTPYLARKLSLNSPVEVLKLLNSNTENPCLIWNNATRAELCEYLESQQTSSIRSGESDPNFGAEFTYTIHKNELVIGEIFIRVYNEQPTFPIENPRSFTLDLLDYIGAQAQYLHSLNSLSEANTAPVLCKDRLKHVEMALGALRNIIRNNAGVEIQCIGHFKLLFSLLRLDGCESIRLLVLELISAVTGNNECVNDIAASEVLIYLLLVIESLPEGRLTVLEILTALASNTKIIKQALVKGAAIYLLDLFCNSTNPTIREHTADLMAKMTTDKLVGPKMRILLSKFLPSIFMDAMRDSPETSVHMFEGTHENPELIWNDEAKARVCETVKNLKQEHYMQQKDNPATVWKLPEDEVAAFTAAQGEYAIGGVYLRLYIANPGWVLRRPKEFLGELLNTCLGLMSKDNVDNDSLELVTTALVSLLHAHSTLANHIPNLGHIPRMLQVMGSKNEAVPRSCLLIVQQLAASDLCVQSLAQYECISPIKRAMKLRSDMVDVACEALHRMFQNVPEELVQQALKSELVEYLLGLLDKGLEASENPSSTKAHIVKTLKSMSRSLQYGDQVSNILDKSKLWAEYKDQKHDLFINSTNSPAYLTAAAPGVAGYLTQGTTRTMPDVPPPITSEDFQSPHKDIL